MLRRMPKSLIAALALAALGLTAAGCQAETGMAEKPQKPLPPGVIAPLEPKDGRLVPAVRVCAAESLQHLVGQPASVLEGMKLRGSVRVLRPGMMVTQEYRLDRLTIEVDANEIIIRVACG